MIDRHGQGRGAEWLLLGVVSLASCTAGPEASDDRGPPGLGGCPSGTLCTGGNPGGGLVDASFPVLFDGGGAIFPGLDGALSPYDAGGGFTGGDVPASDASLAPGVPCGVAAVLSKHCASCHGAPLAFGAPMPLLTLADFQAAAFSNRAQKVHQAIPGRLAPTDTNRKMPPTSKPALSPAELMTLRDWASAGAPAGTPSCAISDTSVLPGTGGGDAGASAGSSGGAHITPIEYNDPDMECYNLVAFANGNKTRKYSVPGYATDSYVNFYYKAPWTGTRYTRSVEIITDNKQVIHHWLLFNNQSPELDGTAQTALGTHGFDEELLYGWAPGASPMYLDPDVGQKLEGGTGFTLEAHYNNPSALSGPDASGAKLCVTKKVPAHEAGLSWVGTDAILGTSASGTCYPESKEIHIIVAQPHMHKKGKHMKVVVNRASGKQETIHDEDFSFENQRYYPLNVVLKPGDSMTTTCEYNGLATFGRGTEEEMCYFFSLHWPAGALVGGLGGILHGGYSCL